MAMFVEGLDNFSEPERYFFAHRVKNEKIRVWSLGRLAKALQNMIYVQKTVPLSAYDFK